MAGAGVTGAFTKFRLLMWKNFLQQWRHRIQTLVETLLPVITLTLILLLRWQIEPRMESTQTFQALPAHTLDYSSRILGGMNLTQLSIAYSPESPVLENVLREAIAKLFTQNMRHFIPTILERHPEIAKSMLLDVQNPINETVADVIQSFITIYAYNSSDNLRGVYSTEEVTRRIIAAVEFDDELYGATQLTRNLKYSLRFPEKPRQYAFYWQGSQTWHTDSIFPDIQLPGPREPYSSYGGASPGYVIEMYIALQHFISMELIAQVTEQDLADFSVAIQRYPHPEYLDDLVLEILPLLLPVIIMASFSYTSVNIIKAITVEKELQLKETMKIMGLPTWLHWTAWFCKQFIYLLIIGVLVVILLKVNWFTTNEGLNYAVLTNTPWSVLLFFLLLYLTCVIFFCFMISSFFSKSSTAAMFSGLFWFLSYLPAIVLMFEIQISPAVQALLCLSVNTAMAFGVQLLLNEEGIGGMQWNKFWQTVDLDSNRFVFGMVVVMLLIDCVLYLLVALYLEQVFPGPYGAPKPWYFLFQKSFWCPTRVKPDYVLNDFQDNTGIVTEPMTGDNSTGVKMTNLTKAYKGNVVVNNLNLDIYDGQITVLLGHNGAGKSTTISMITGNIEITSGSVLVAGHDVAKETEAARASIGFCPQHNVLFNDLTVREHLEFFARLKGFTGQELREDIDTLIAKLELEEKRDYLAAGLSGGQKRRLSVGIALCGAPRVVLLDEPTSGMDVASRRALWDLLQKEKNDRSMILTTHFMDEADILGDRVAIMSSGRLQCIGSPYFLKSHYGIGYTLVVVKKEGFKIETCTEVIRRHIPDITIKEDRGTEITYALSNDMLHLFGAMLNDLEANIETIKFKNYGLAATTLEDVFMSVGSDLASSRLATDDDTITASSRDENDTINISSSMDQLVDEYEMLSGIRLWTQHVLAVWLKLLLIWSRSWRMLMLQFLLPLLLLSLTLGIMQGIPSTQRSLVPRALTLAQGYRETESVLSYNGTSQSSLGALGAAAYELMFLSSNIDTMKITVVENQPVDDYYLLRTERPSDMADLRNRMLTGATFGDNSATAWFSNFGYHDVAISLNAIHEALLKAWDSDASLEVFNHPLEVNYNDQDNVQLEVMLLTLQIASGIASSIGIVSAVFVMFYTKERILRAKLLQKSAGIQPVIMWGSAAVFDWLWFLIVCVTIVIPLAAFQVQGLSTASELGQLYLAFMVYGAAMLPLHYLVSLLFRRPATGFVIMYFINIVFGQIAPQILEALLIPLVDAEQMARTLDSILQFYPLYSLVRSIMLMTNIATTKWMCMSTCEILSGVLPIEECSLQLMCDNDFPTCCLNDNSLFNWEEPGILRYLTAMLGSGVVLWILFMCIEYNVFNKIFYRTKNPPARNESALDDDVVAEIKHVDRIGKNDMSEHNLVAKNLSKYYGKHLAVNQVSFSVANAEVFGLLGVNGAGKTTTFKMLMGDESVSSGDAFVNGYSVKTDITSVHKNIGYCPQFDAVFGELTGRETLRLFSMLRGLPSQYASRRVNMLADSLGFSQHLDKRVDQFSGGNKRKLSTAISLLSITRLVFVDEPTTGVDPAAKRQVWRAIRNASQAGCGVVLTSHSMEECEALCSRLTIMAHGSFQCLGTPQHLKNKFSQGFTLKIKMKMVEVRTNSTSNAQGTEAVKRFIETNFTTPSLIEEYQGLLTYYLPDQTVAWSKMFTIMERCRQSHDVEDYTISQTSLEQIFLRFAKYQGNTVVALQTQT